MRIARVLHANVARWALVEADGLHVLTAPPTLAQVRGGGLGRTGEVVALSNAVWLPPATPSKIVCVGTNYRAHAIEMGRALPKVPKIFFKPPSALVPTLSPIVLPPDTTRVDPESELAVVLGARLSRATPEEARAAVLGYTALNDVTCRDFQKQDGVFARAKGFDSFCPLGPWIDTDLDPSDLEVSTWVNGERRALGRTSDLIFGVTELLCFISSVMTLEPGDLLSTGTPSGVAPIQAGDRVEVRIEGLPPLVNPVVDRDDRA